MKAKRARSTRILAKHFVTQELGKSKFGKAARFIVEIIRVGPRRLDDDNCAYSAKQIRDGIADAIGIDDGSPRYTWKYSQEKSKDYSVRIVIEVI